jgi:hypothetical protein
VLVLCLCCAGMWCEHDFERAIKSQHTAHRTPRTKHTEHHRTPQNTTEHCTHTLRTRLAHRTPHVWHTAAHTVRVVWSWPGPGEPAVGCGGVG